MIEKHIRLVPFIYGGENVKWRVSFLDEQINYENISTNKYCFVSKYFKNILLQNMKLKHKIKRGKTNKNSDDKKVNSNVFVDHTLKIANPSFDIDTGH